MADLITTFVTSLGAGAGKAGVQEATKLLRDLAGLQDAQLRLLRGIDRKVDALVKGPFHTGRQRLADAAQPGRDPDDRLHLLREARTFLDVSVNQDPDPLRRSLTLLHLATVWHALGGPADVRPRLEAAQAEALVAMLAEGGRRAGGIKSLRSRFSVMERIEEEMSSWGAAIHGLGPYVKALARTARRFGSANELAPLFMAGSNDPDSSPAEQLLGMAASRLVLERQFAKEGHALPVPPQWWGETADFTARRGHAQAEARARRGEVLLWLDLQRFGEGGHPWVDAPYWAVLGGYLARG